MTVFWKRRVPFLLLITVLGFAGLLVHRSRGRNSPPLHASGGEYLQIAVPRINPAFLQANAQRDDALIYPNGNTLIDEDGTTTGDLYDAENRLIKRGANIEIEYDHDGNRARKTVNGVTTYYLLDDRNHSGYVQVLAEYGNTNDPPDRAYTYGHDLIAQRRNTGTASVPVWETSYYGYDGLGSVRLLTDDATGSSTDITDTYDYDAYGKLIAQTPAPGSQTPNRYLYTGEQWDADLGLYHLRARYLNPNTGRFWTMDSYEGNSSEPSSLHKYLYCHANPVNGTDPMGMFTQQLGYLAEAAIGQIYARDHPGDLVGYGSWTRLGGSGNPAYRLKPDIFNMSSKRWAEIKPLSPSGLTKAAVQYGTYTAAFMWFNYWPDAGWRPSTHHALAGAVPILFFNAGGVIFYTDVLDMAEDALATATILGARNLLIKYSARTAGQTLIPALTRITVLAAGGKTADTARVEAHAGIAALLGLLGAL